MKVTIVGAGNMGRGIGTRLVAGGNDVELVDRDPAEARALAEVLQATAKGGASATAIEPDSAFGGEVVVLALYYPSLAEAVAQYADRLAGKVVVEISNSVDFTTFDGLVTPPARSSSTGSRQRRRTRGRSPHVAANGRPAKPATLLRHRKRRRSVGAAESAPQRA